MPPFHHGRSWVEIDSDALAHNARVARHAAGGAAVMAVVKADAYGHGYGRAVRALSSEVDAFGVATFEEATAVRDVAGADATVLILGGLLPEEREMAIGHGHHVTISSLAEAEAYHQLALQRGKAAHAHVIADTGMGRMGFLETEFADAIHQIATMGGIEIKGIATHFPSADEDPEFTRAQIAAFATLREQVGIAPPWIHLANSAGILGFGAAGGNLVRPGLMLYGVSPLPEHADKLRPVLEWKARITQVRDLPVGTGISYGQSFVTERPTRVATVAVGYGDGYPRHLSGRGAELLVAGRRCRLLGRVTMDMVMIDVSALEAAPEVGDQVTLIGREGGESITAADLAAKAGTIPWEILTGIAPRVARVAVPSNS